MQAPPPGGCCQQLPDAFFLPLVELCTYEQLLRPSSLPTFAPPLTLQLGQASISPALGTRDPMGGPGPILQPWQQTGSLGEGLCR